MFYHRPNFYNFTPVEKPEVKRAYIIRNLGILSRGSSTKHNTGGWIDDHKEIGFCVELWSCPLAVAFIRVGALHYIINIKA